MANILEMVKYNADGLVPAAAQDIRTDEVLMLAYMNEESLKKTIETGLVHYYSRSRQKLWCKGETSGHYQKVRSISIDCDGDTLLIKVEQTGAACHTGHRSCFFTRLETDELKAGAGMISDTAAAGNDSVPDFAPDNTAGTDTAGAEVLGKVFGVICDRKAHPKEGSYTNYLFTKGLDKILKKVGEEACEVVIASKNGSPGDISAEVADLFYHIMVLLAQQGMTLNDIYEELKKRE
ncbi:MAG: bifunctional phosphoribosyl-AMP cyclohydrolase/phosphoribosyl-ATP diphosphatase HisIE [Clostridiaceae bacterium]|jgi:phosphoribosyl-ATP pyrophosphohydrolase/phosphoribosyl-AMP cyclohydrolase|nr:bifunctional phosphoribosyl-AMP cyclohydrolase/phosphoribosyl-ATP diphosphatase HisIE [Clostridiaceae bacterium]